uniref:Uncharacterized protein n=1 Tax=Rhizophora mucronata TaxID=61149 RepID=A0A2P2PWW5_RHIMU
MGNASTFKGRGISYLNTNRIHNSFMQL